MSSVTPSENYSSYGMKHLSDLEDELKRDHARTEQRTQQRAEELEKSYREARNKHEERTNRAVDEIRDEFQESAAKSRENDRAEIERIRKMNYDRFGRNRTNEADIYKNQLNETIESSRVQHDADMKRLQDTEKGYLKHLDDMNKDHNDRLDRAVQTTRDSANEAFATAFEDGRSVADAQRIEANKRYAELNRQGIEEKQDLRRQVNQVVTDMNRDMENRKFHQDASTEQRLANDHRAYERKIEEAAEKNRIENSAQTRHLRDQIEDLVNNEDTYMKEKGQGRADAVREYENDWRTREKLIQEGSERQLTKLKQSQEENEDRIHHANNRNLREKDTYFTKLVGRMNTEARENQKAIENRYETAHTQLENRMKNDRSRAQEQLESALHESNQQRREALEGQARSYQNSIETQQSLNSDKIRSLEGELQRKTAPSDTLEISPAVEGAVRRSIAKEYEKNFNAESDRNRRNVDALQRSHSDRLQSAIADHQRDVTSREKQNTSERHLEEMRFMEHISDTEYQKQQALTNKEVEHERQTDSMNRSFARQSERQRAEYESMIQNLRDDATVKITAIRQEADFQAKTAQRAFAIKQNELIREYEKKLADQKTDFDGRLDDLRTQSQLTQRDLERKGKQAFDEQARTYEQRISQLEAQHQERVRSISQNYQEELEKVKRNNALQSSKKG